MNRCSVKECGAAAAFEVILYDVSPLLGDIFFERDYTCPFLCARHMAENEEGARGERRPHGQVVYPYSNRHHATGFTIYVPLHADEYQASRTRSDGAAESSPELPARGTGAPAGPAVFRAFTSGALRLGNV
jgi:hypothetical protein